MLRLHWVLFLALANGVGRLEPAFSQTPGPSPAPARQNAPLLLAPGEQRWLKSPSLSRYTLGGTGVRARSFPERGGILIKAVNPGISDLWIWNADGSSEQRTVRVEKQLPPGASLEAGLERALGALEEVEVYVAGATATLRGEIRTLSEAARIASLIRAFPDKLQDEARSSEALLAQAARNLEHWIRNSDRSSSLRVERHGSRLWVRGNLTRPTELPGVLREIHALYPLAETEIETLPDSTPTIHFRVFLLELKRNQFGSFGLDWPAGQEGAFRITTSGILDRLQLDLAIQALEGAGSARILSRPELVVRAPGEAELFAGGELPIHSRQNRYSSSVIWKNYGLTLRLKVTHSAGDRVRLEIFTEVSSLNPSAGLSDIPGIQANRMKTQVDARFGIPLLLSGLLQQGTRENARGLPLLRRLPVLGGLFGSEDYLNERSELVAILLPEATPPRAPMERFLPPSPEAGAGETLPPLESVAAATRSGSSRPHPRSRPHVRGELWRR